MDNSNTLRYGYGVDGCVTMIGCLVVGLVCRFRTFFCIISGCSLLLCPKIVTSNSTYYGPLVLVQGPPLKVGAHSSFYAYISLNNHRHWTSTWLSDYLNSAEFIKPFGDRPTHRDLLCTIRVQVIVLVLAGVSNFDCLNSAQDSVEPPSLRLGLEPQIGWSGRWGAVYQRCGCFER